MTDEAFHEILDEIEGLTGDEIKELMKGEKMKDGGVAFPSVIGDVGMTLRDYFAGQALVGMLANGGYAVTKSAGRDIKEAIADTVYEMADAMLAAREK